jgi:hypothetical protein
MLLAASEPPEPPELMLEKRLESLDERARSCRAARHWAL